MNVNFKYAKGARFTHRHLPNFRERYAQDAYSHLIDRVVPLKINGHVMAGLRVLKATIAPDGTYADVEYEVL